MVPLGDAQVILGTVWLKNLGPTLWDFTQKTLRFWKDGKVTLQGTFHKEIDLIEGKLLVKLLQTKGLAYMLQFVESGDGEEFELYSRELGDILKEFPSVFEEPKGLSPLEVVIIAFLWLILNSHPMPDHIDIHFIRRMRSRGR